MISIRSTCATKMSMCWVSQFIILFSRTSWKIYGSRKRWMGRLYIFLTRKIIARIPTINASMRRRREIIFQLMTKMAHFISQIQPMVSILLLILSWNHQRKNISIFFNNMYQFFNRGTCALIRYKNSYYILLIS